MTNHKFPKFLERYVLANIADPDHIMLLLKQQSDKGLHCLHFHLHLWWQFSAVIPLCSDFRVITIKVQNFWTPGFAVIYLKFKQRDQTLGYYIKKMQME